MIPDKKLPNETLINAVSQLLESLQISEQYLGELLTLKALISLISIFSLYIRRRKLLAI
jgi:hypothetical protein